MDNPRSLNIHGYAAVADLNDPVRHLRDAPIVRDDHERRADALVDLTHQVVDGLRRIGVQVARRLICQDDFRLVHQGPGDRRSLLLAPRHFAGRIVLDLLQPHQAHDLVGALNRRPGCRAMQDAVRHQDVLDGRELRQ